MRLFALIALSACGPPESTLDGGCLTTSVPETVAAEPAEIGRDSYIVDLTSDGASLYWANRYTGTINRVTKDGAEVQVLRAGEVCPTHIAVDSTTLYWITCDGSVRSQPKVGGAPNTLAMGADCAGSECGQGIAVDADAVYWVDSAYNEIVRWSKADSVTTIIATDVFGLMGSKSFVAASGTVYWGGTELKGSLLFGALWSVSPGTPKRMNALLDELDVVEAVAVDDAQFYAVTTKGGVWSVGRSEGEPVRIAAVAPAPQSVAVDATGIYVDEGRRLLRIRDDGSATDLACGPQTGAGTIVLDDSQIYWLGERAAILSLPK